jgi:hypothetical protein
MLLLVGILNAICINNRCIKGKDKEWELIALSLSMNLIIRPKLIRDICKSAVIQDRGPVN